MTETNLTKPVVASEEPPPSEAVTGSPPSATTKTITLSRSPSPPSPEETTAVTGSPPPATTTAILSSRSPSPPTPEEITTAEPTAIDTVERESLTDPQVVALRAMFPDYDDTILQSVLESVDGNQDHAVDTLLIMSDPDYKPEPPQPQRPQRRHTAPVLTQEQLDEQFARQLVIQEEQQMTQHAVGRLQGPPGTYPVWSHPGHPGGPARQPAQSPQTNQGQGVGEIQEQFTKFAETGKKTIGNFLTKVKTKFQEFEQGRASGPSTTQYSSQQWTPGPASYYGPPQADQPPQGFQYAGQSSPTSAPLPPSKSSLPPPINQDPTSATTSTPKTLTTTVPPPLTSPAPPIDGGKLGLLPKRPVSLIRDDSPTVVGKNTTAVSSGSTTTPPGTTSKGYTVDDDDDDGLEYAESPFDEPAHKK